MKSETRDFFIELATIYHDYGMSLKEAQILMTMLGNEQNIKTLLNRLEKLLEINKTVLYMETTKVLLNL